MSRWLSAGAPFSSRRVVICGVVGCFLFFQLKSFVQKVNIQVEKLKLAGILSIHPLYLHDIGLVEQMTLLPPYGLKSSEKTNFNDEFLDPSSRTRSIFFPSPEYFGLVDPRNNADNATRLYYLPDRVWLDTDGNPIQAHGGGILFDKKSKTYYWYGESKNGSTYVSPETGTPRVDFIGICCYSSKDLWSWKNEGVVLPAEERNEAHDLYKMNVVERPRVIYNERSGKYVMWIHVDDVAYTKASVGVAVSDSPAGPFEYLSSRRPNGFDSRDMTVFQDDDGIGAYLIYSALENREIHITSLNEDYLDVTSDMAKVLVGQHRAAPVLFKNQGIYYMITSGCSGLAPNEALVHEAETISGPWETIGNPCVGANKVFRAATFFSQGTFVIPMPPGSPLGSFVFMADRWNTADLRDSRYLWLPLTVSPMERRYPGLPLWSRVSIIWTAKWKIPFTDDTIRDEF
ncbi:uncharacterized protein [Henckelia pumila]|uniref:uncharacterized protein n=1 Tax=Henckelia pumila TaxID=405737 RepID=UPI003C6E0CB9